MWPCTNSCWAYCVLCIRTTWPFSMKSSWSCRHSPAKPWRQSLTCTVESGERSVLCCACHCLCISVPPQPFRTDSAEIVERVSIWVVVVVAAVVVRELFSLMTSAICVWIRGHGSDVKKIVYHMAQVFCLLLHSYHSGFAGTISSLFCYVNIKLILSFVD